MREQSQKLMSACVLGLWLTACGDNPAANGQQHDSGEHHDGGDHHDGSDHHDGGEHHDGGAHEAGADYVPCDPKLPPLEVGSEVVGKVLTLKVVGVTPLPLLKGTSNWEVELRSNQGELVTDLAVTRAWTYMVVHAHTGNFEPKFTALEEPGHYAFKGFNFTMRGPWQVRFDLSSETAGDDFLVFDVCVEPE